ncbi:MAG: SRPBCC domain-containing protein [Kangiella sp.]|nr:SRPBCC domain-containing protein [Kangiella sp.]
MKIITLVISLLVTVPAQAEVTEVSEQHFTISIETTLKAPSDQAYQQFLQIGDWWQDSHTWFGDASTMSIEPKAGGCFCERNGDKQALHMTIAHVNPGISVQMIGGLGPLQSLAVNGHMLWKFESTEDGNTTLTLTYRVTGFINQNTEDWSKAVNGVLQQQVDSLSKLLNE